MLMNMYEGILLFTSIGNRQGCASKRGFTVAYMMYSQDVDEILEVLRQVHKL